MFLLSFLLLHLVPVSSPLITPIKGKDGEPDLDSIINHITLLEQNMSEMNALKTKVAVLESEVARLTSDVGTCQTDIAMMKAQMQTMDSVKDCCAAATSSIHNLTVVETYVENQVSSLKNDLTDVYNKSTFNSALLKSIHSMYDLVTIEGWVLVFRAQADIGISVYDTWMNDIYFDNPLLPRLVDPACQSLETSHPCPVHFKSRIVPLWESVNIQQVKVLLIKDSQIRQEIIFDGVGTTRTSWFTRARVVNSTWTDLKTAPSNFFSIKGDEIVVHRHFYINSEYNGCTNDESWLTVVDASVAQCSWDTVNSIPKIIYSKGSTRSKMGTDLHDFEYADIMAILVKLGDM